MSDSNQLHGVGASPGIAVGPVVTAITATVTLEGIDDPIPAITESAGRVSQKLSSLSADAKAAGREEAGEVLGAQALMAEDDMVIDAVSEHLDGNDLETAFEAATTQLEQMLASIPDPYLAARAADIGEVMAAIKRDLAGVDADGISLTEPSILVAEELTAAETAGLDVDMVLGFATVTGGATSHVAIIARSLGVPAVVGVEGLLDAPMDRAALDGSTGEFHASPDAAVEADFADREATQAALEERLAEVHGAEAALAGKGRIEVAGNVASPDDIDRAVGAASDGVGLFRTEFLFLDTPKPPSEEEQYEIYARAAKAWTDTVVIRTFDIGGDKPAEYLDLPEEENPFLGLRGVRIYEQFKNLLDDQLRAALRAAAHGKVAVMVPMVATLDEFFLVRDRMAAVKESLAADGIEHGSVELGVMVEVPSVALIAPSFAEHVDFFSIGTNDLTQYTMAADRLLGSLSALHDPLHPAVLRLCAMVADAAATKGQSVSVCGLAAADPLAAVIFASIGINKLSVSANAVNLIKATLNAQDASIVDRVVEVLSKASNAAEVREGLEPHLVRP